MSKGQGKNTIAINTILTEGIQTSLDDSDEMQLVTVNIAEDEVIANADRLQQYGFSSNPPNESGTLIGCINGDKENPVIILSDTSDKRPIDNPSGDVIVWHISGTKIHLKDDGSIFIESSNKTINITGDIIVNGALNVLGDITSDTGNITSTTGIVEGIFVKDVQNDLTLHGHATAPVGPVTPATPYPPIP